MLAGIGIAVVAKVPGPPWLFGRAEPGDTARARLIGWQCILQAAFPVAIGGLHLSHGLGDAVRIVLLVVLIGSFVGMFVVNRRLCAAARGR